MGAKELQSGSLVEQQRTHFAGNICNKVVKQTMRNKKNMHSSYLEIEISACREETLFHTLTEHDFKQTIMNQQLLKRETFGSGKKVHQLRKAKPDS